MRLKGIIAAATAVALVATPTVAAAQSSAAAARTATTEVAPAGETVEGNQLRGGFIIPLIALVAIILGILAALDDNDNDLPHSP